MAARGEKLELSHHVELESAPASVFLARVVAGEAPNVRLDDWATSATSLAPLGDPVLRVSARGREHGLFVRDRVFVHVTLFGGRVIASLAGPDERSVGAAYDALRGELPPPDPSSAHEVAVTFWTYTPHGPQPLSRSISVPEWSDIRDNYAAATRARLEALMRGFEPARGGQLVLWHGKVGTGKTYALRALAWEWREWCELHYIVDPDSFFGQHADYHMNVLLQPTFDEDLEIGAGWTAYGPEAMSIELGRDGPPSAKAWKLLVLEDTGELLAPDAKAVIGQGLSRFLNVVDGLIGQGLRVLVLVTTNEEVRRLHPAVARPGRCAANVEFHPLSATEAREWLERHGSEQGVTAPTTLASLYAALGSFDAAEFERTPGFGR